MTTHTVIAEDLTNQQWYRLTFHYEFDGVKIENLHENWTQYDKTINVWADPCNVIDSLGLYPIWDTLEPLVPDMIPTEAFCGFHNRPNCKPTGY